ncbi:MAG: cation:proton antiporter [Fibrobacterota bacterium]
MKPIRTILTGGVLLAGAGAVHASDTGTSSPAGGGITHQMMMLVIQIGIILFAARLGGSLFKRLRLPSVLGELVSGIIIGPYLLGGIAFPGFSEGFFPLNVSAGIPVSAELYGIATVASIILLFLAGLETDLKMFLRFSLAGSIIGVGGVVFSFVIGDITAMYFLDAAFMDPAPLFLGVMSTATSVGITVRILSEKRKLDSPEGVTILAGAVIDDILGIILLAVVMGISFLDASTGQTDWNSIAMIGVKAIGVWIGFTALGLYFSDHLARLMKMNRSIDTIAVLSLGLALIVAGVFEKAGLAMIIGAYVMGLTFSKTDLNLSIQEKLHTLELFFVPIFFTTIGMFVDVQSLLSPWVLYFGIVFTVGAVFAKMIGCGAASLFLNFNRLGALRIGFGMIPRGEVALIIAGIGLSSGILNKDVFSVSVVMTLLTTIIAPVILERLLAVDAKGTRRDVVTTESVQIPFQCSSSDVADLVESNIIQSFSSEGFYVNRVEADDRVFHFQKDTSLITLFRRDDEMLFEANERDESFVKNMLYESMAELSSIVNKIKDYVKPEDMKKEFAKSSTRADFDMSRIFRPELIELNLTSKSKEDVINELIRILYENGAITDRNEALNAVVERENAVSTGMENGVALPHGRITGVDGLTTVVGFSREGIDFNAMDGKPSHVFVLTLVPSHKQVPYVQFLAALSSRLNGREKVDTILSLETKVEVIDFFLYENK